MINGEYKTQEVELKWQKYWEARQTYKWNENEPREVSFIIDTPPPTVSGMLHMGHIFSYTQADFIARFQRMNGKNVFYPIGFDDNGLPTERLVEKIKGVRAGQMDRSDFIKLCQEVVVESEEEFRSLFRSVGMSFDWSQEYQTISERSRSLSQLSFIDLHNKGYIERRHAPTFWDPADKTAIAQAEIEDKEKTGFMHDILFSTEDGEKITIATTRPELIPACVAVIYNPEDQRYQNLKGKNAVTAIYNVTVPIIADTGVEMDKGTGLVMCCTFGDYKDVEWWRNYKLPLKECIGLNGRMQNSGFLDGMTVNEARKKITEELEALLLLTQKTEIVQFVKCAERSGAALELVSTPQWYIRTLDYKDQLLEQARKCEWHPGYMQVRIENWINGLNQDWCISRQRYFGVPFPVWYSKRAGEEGKILVADPAQLPVDPLKDLPAGYTSDEVTPDKDVMDTWATSAVTPQLNSHGISSEHYINHERHKKLYPADLRPQGHEIIRTWAFASITKSYYHENTIPWKHLMISGWCLAADKTKMSKSKGNVVTPRELIVEKGADVVRYWAATSKLGVDIVYSEEVFKIGRKLCTKLWNASRFAATHFANISGTPSTPVKDVEHGIIFETLDKWILSRLRKTIATATDCFNQFEYSDARVAVEDFFWNDFCDNYLELVKVRIYCEESDKQKARQSAIYTIHHCLQVLFRLFAPVLPHLSEELNQIIFNSEETINGRGTWPKIADHFYDEVAEKEGIAVKDILEAVRKYKSVNNISLRTPLEFLQYKIPAKLNRSAELDLQNAANAKSITAVETFEFPTTLKMENSEVEIFTAKGEDQPEPRQASS
jgi:valyl-tRNA synthetase